jgi:hypothetical protein
VFVCEAFVLVVNSCLKGFVAGYVVAAVMAWQRELFSSVTVSLTFKLEYLGVVLVAAVGSALLATYREMSHTLSRKISDLLTSND